MLEQQPEQPKLTNKQFLKRIQTHMEDLILLSDRACGRMPEPAEVMEALMYMFSFNLWAMQLQVKKMAHQKLSREELDKRNAKFMHWWTAENGAHEDERGVPELRALAAHYRKLYEVAADWPVCEAIAASFMQTAAWAHNMLLTGVGDKEKTATLIKTYWEKAHAETERKTGD